MQHTKSIPALYRGYKRRNLQLDALAQSTPTYLVKSKVPLVNQTFTDVESEDTLRQLHNYLFKRYNLLESVIRSRKLHHSHFFAVDNDYGHEKFLAQLQKEKHTTARALERLGRERQMFVTSNRSGSNGYDNAKTMRSLAARMKAGKSGLRRNSLSGIKRKLSSTREQWKHGKNRNSRKLS